MALERSDIEDGTGLTTALVYDSVTDAAAWLARYRYPAFVAADEDDQEVALIRATQAAEDALRDLVRGLRVTDGQALIFPAFGAYDSSGRLMFEDERPLEYRRGIFLLAEAIAANRFMPHAGTVPGLLSESSRNGSMTYSAGIDFNSLGANHPDAWRKIATAIPSL